MPNSSELQLSFILPIYNVEPYLEKCIRSLENQDIPKDSYELICVNDGSPDNCLQIIKELQKEFNNIVLIDQKNQGVSVARNNGIKAAKGKYLMFVDPDDFIDSNQLKKSITEMNCNRIDIGVAGFKQVSSEGSVLYNFPIHKKHQPISGIYFFNKFYKTNSYKLPDRSCGIFFRRKFLIENNLFYLEKVPYLEDGAFMNKAYCLANKVIFIDSSFYNILIRPGSATFGQNSQNMKSIKGFLRTTLDLKEFQSKFNKNSEQYVFLNQYVTKYTLLMLQSAINSKDLNKIFWVYRSLKENKLQKLDVTGNKGKFKNMGLIYNCSIICFSSFWIMRQLYYKLKIYLK